MARVITTQQWHHANHQASGCRDNANQEGSLLLLAHSTRRLLHTSPAAAPTTIAINPQGSTDENITETDNMDWIGVHRRHRFGSVQSGKNLGAGLKRARTSERTNPIFGQP
jgi:hypothetical protein